MGTAATAKSSFVNDTISLKSDRYFQCKKVTEEVFCHLPSATESLLVETIMELTVNHLGGVRFLASTTDHQIICDQPVEHGGTGQGMTPPELLLASLGTCAGYYAAEYIRARSLPIEGLSVKVTAEKLTQPARLDHFSIEVQAPGVDDPRHIEGIVRAVNRCLIHNTLHANPEINVHVVANQVEAVTLS
jgi:uncharacterized OsmC-like protein